MNIHRVIADNNAVYRAISWVFYQTEEHHSVIRTALAIFSERYKTHIFSKNTHNILNSFIESILSLDFPASITEIYLLVLLLKRPINICLQQGGETELGFVNDQQLQHFFNLSLLQVNKLFPSVDDTQIITLFLESTHFCGLYQSDPQYNRPDVNIISTFIDTTFFSTLEPITPHQLNTYTLNSFKTAFTTRGPFNHSSRIEECRKIAHNYKPINTNVNGCIENAQRDIPINTTTSRKRSCTNVVTTTVSKHLRSATIDTDSSVPTQESYFPPSDSENHKIIDSWLKNEETSDLLVCVCCRLFLSCLPDKNNYITTNVDEIISNNNHLLGYDSINESVWSFAKKVICNTCAGQIRKKPNCIPNNSPKSCSLSLGSITKENTSILQKLNLVEQMIIARIICWLPLRQLTKNKIDGCTAQPMTRCGNLSLLLKGKLAFIPHCAMKTLANLIPRTPRDICHLIVGLRRSQRAHDSLRMVVDPSLCLKALNIFYNNGHPGYKDIWRSDSLLRDAFATWNIQNDNPITFNNYPTVPNDLLNFYENISEYSSEESDTEGQQQMGNTSHIYLEPTNEAILDSHCFEENENPSIHSLCPTSGISPLREWCFNDAVVHAFPHLFPSGTSYFINAKTNKMRHDTYVHLRLFDINQSFGTDSAYMAFESYCRTCRKMVKCIQHLPGGIFNNKLSFYPNDDTENQMQQWKKDQSKTHMEGFKYLNEIPDTPGYWNVKQQEVMALIEQIGSPTFFNTYTVNETEWFHLTRYLYAVKHHQLLTRDNFNTMSKQEIAKLSQEHQAVFVACIYRIFNSFLHNVLEYFFGEITNSTVRVEFQKRGAPHFHCLF